jgi:hypothetical protein
VRINGREERRKGADSMSPEEEDDRSAIGDLRADEPGRPARYAMLRMGAPSPSAVDAFVAAKKREEQARRKTLTDAADICEAEGRREMGAALRRMAW